LFPLLVCYFKDKVLLLRWQFCKGIASNISIFRRFYYKSCPKLGIPSFIPSNRFWLIVCFLNISNDNSSSFFQSLQTSDCSLWIDVVNLRALIASVPSCPMTPFCQVPTPGLFTGSLRWGSSRGCESSLFSASLWSPLSHRLISFWSSSGFRENNE